MEILNVIQLLATDFCTEAKPIFQFLGHIVNILQIAIPVIIILLGTIDLGKAVMAGEDKKIKEAQKMLLMRLIYGAAVFFVVTVVKIVFGLVADVGEGANTSSVCFACVASPGKC